MTHTYIQAIKQPTLGYLTRSVRRRAATSKQRLKGSFVAESFDGIEAGGAGRGVQSGDEADDDRESDGA